LKKILKHRFHTTLNLTDEDIELFMSLGNQMAIAIENNEYIKRSTEMVKKLTEAEVREKYLKELEDTNQSFQRSNWYFLYRFHIYLL